MALYEPIGMDKIQEAKINPRTHKEEQKRKAEQQLLYRIQLEALRQIVELSEASEITPEFWKVLARISVNHSWDDVLREVCKRRGVEYTCDSTRNEVLQQQINGLSWSELRGLIVELILYRELVNWGEPRKDFIDACRLHDIDLKEIENRIKTEGKKKKGKKGREATLERGKKKPVVIEEV